jgi:hypothetical protein
MKSISSLRGDTRALRPEPRPLEHLTRRLPDADTQVAAVGQSSIGALTNLARALSGEPKVCPKSLYSLD